MITATNENKLSVIFSVKCYVIPLQKKKPTSGGGSNGSIFVGSSGGIAVVVIQGKWKIL